MATPRKRTTPAPKRPVPARPTPAPAPGRKTPPKSGPLPATPTGPTGPRPGVPVAPGIPATGPTDAEKRSATAAIAKFLQPYGLDALAAGAWGQWLLTGGDIDAVWEWVRASTEYKTRFSGMEELRQKGQAISEDQYINIEREYVSRLRQYGMPDSISSDRAFLGRLIGEWVSPDELADRLGYYSKVVGEGVPAETRAYMATHFGITDGDLMAFWLNPDQALPELERKSKAASLGGAVARTGWGDLDTDRALRYADLGLNEGQVANAYGEAGHLKELQSQLPGDPGGTTIGSFSVQDAMLEGSIGARNQVEYAQRRRQAQFEGGGQVAAGRGGIAGLGSAAS